MTLLAVYAPGLAAAPQRADLAAREPFVVMSRLPGEPLRGQPLSDHQLKALAAAVSELQAAVPADALKEIPLRPGHQDQLVAQIHAWTPQARRRAGSEVGAAMDRGLEWLGGSCLAQVGDQIRPGEFWNHPDLDRYRSEKMVVIDFEPARA